MATATAPAQCGGPACGGRGQRIPAGVGGQVLLCATCDGRQLVHGPLLPRPAGGYDRSHFTGKS